MLVGRGVRLDAEQKNEIETNLNKSGLAKVEKEFRRRKLSQAFLLSGDVICNVLNEVIAECVPPVFGDHLMGLILNSCNLIAIRHFDPHSVAYIFQFYPRPDAPMQACAAIGAYWHAAFANYGSRSKAFAPAQMAEAKAWAERQSTSELMTFVKTRIPPDQQLELWGETEVTEADARNFAMLGYLLQRYDTFLLPFLRQVPMPDCATTGRTRILTIDYHPEHVEEYDAQLFQDLRFGFTPLSIEAGDEGIFPVAIESIEQLAHYEHSEFVIENT